MLLALGPCDNGALPGDPQDPGESSTQVSATPTPKATPTPSPTPSEPAVLSIASVSFVDAAGSEVSELSVKKSSSVKIGVKVSLSDGTSKIAYATYDDSAITWKTSSPAVLQLLNNQGNFKALSTGISYVIAKHAKFTKTLKVTVRP